ncbi:hypothetical protein FPANT_2922 [Fusarium pseudoanthophilum]|uniref:Uncharacterized protein n=1 Tax=Fusarium pseudoanthophilum TaxID=48495 RepID=A0A8H5UWE9_9HYPO|nr:hypothetical protein FPANT_2922 [Fusarium pseudoanthophilum]
MRSPTFLRLAFGLLAGGCAIASPCKPSSVATTSAGSSTISTGTSSETSIASSTADESATTSVLSEPSSGAYPSSSVEVSSSVTFQISETTAESSTIETTTAEPTTIESTTTTAAASTTEAISVLTFSLFATGQGPVEEEGLHTYDSDGSVAVFDPSPIFGDASVRPYTIDSQGRLVNDQGFFLCVFYIATNVNLDSPASVGTCTSSGPKKAFLNCQLSADLAIQCSVPGRSCEANLIGEPLCDETGEPWSVLSVGTVVVGHGLFIGPSDTPDSFDRIGLCVEEV